MLLMLFVDVLLENALSTWFDRKLVKQVKKYYNRDGGKFWLVGGKV
jgi:hypothetical protein